jgi:hypothetical protein
VDEKTRIPTSLDEEDPFLKIAEISLSLRQLLTIILTAAVWMVLIQLTILIVPVTEIFAGIIWSWLLLGGLFLALVKKDGRPYEEYLSHRVVYHISNKTFIQKDPNAKYGSVEDADWEELDEDYGPPSF